MSNYLRGQIAKMANVNIETLRYYENHGLIPSPVRSETGYRLYSDEVLNRLAFIKNAKFCGFTLKEIKKALTKSESSSISLTDFLTVIDKKMERIDAEIAKQKKTLAMLSDLKTNLQAEDQHPEVRATLQMLNMEM
ncbi:MerR family transcriptional regulator, mercuric resistance operon regulatory protein [Paenibacillus sp. 1_12]|uniref:MerR family transcriptional regulator n=1 Tax=Paenibacillus sp. 1_12 TaxID=1566278 RepID=UPI0008F452E5|nr:MerR family transcriptional regulator [Paenibacillus sp. 1_12]SFL24294.1 MerR family transcriptional regulator, mercuric resistance operon regulatory protein [Paenibacillus sp. 1_12]